MRKNEEDWPTSLRADVMSILKNIEELRCFSPKILSADQEFDSNKELPSVDCELLDLFYSECYDERIEAFCLGIKEPLFNALRAISEAFGALTSESLQQFDCFNITAVTEAYPDLMNAAIKDMFERGQLESFSKALEDLVIFPVVGIAKLKECDVWKLACFYHGYAKLLMVIHANTQMDQRHGKSYSELLAKLKSEFDLTVDSRSCHDIWVSIKQPGREQGEKQHKKLVLFMSMLSMMDDFYITAYLRQILQTFDSIEVDDSEYMYAAPSNTSTSVISCNRQLEISLDDLLDGLAASDMPFWLHQNIDFFLHILTFLLSPCSIEQEIALEVLCLLQRCILHSKSNHQSLQWTTTGIQSLTYRNIPNAIVIRPSEKKSSIRFSNRSDLEKTVVQYKAGIRDILHVSEMNTFFSSGSVVEKLHEEGYSFSSFLSIQRFFSNEDKKWYYESKTNALSQQPFSKTRLK